MTDQKTASSNTLFVKAASQADMTKVLQLLAQDVQDVDLYATDEKGRTAAHWMAIKKQKKVLFHMANRCPNLLTTYDDKGITPAMYFAVSGDGDGMVPLVRLNPNVLKQRDNFGATIARILAKEGMVDVLVQLVKICPSILWQTHDDEETIASWLARLEDGAIIAEFDDEQGYTTEQMLEAMASQTTPLDHLLADNVREALSAMVRYNIGSFKRTDKLGATLAMYTAFTPYDEVLEALLEKLPEVLTQADHDGTTLAMCYAVQGKTRALRMLEKIDPNVLSQKDKHGNSVLELLNRYHRCRELANNQ